MRVLMVMRPAVGGMKAQMLALALGLARRGDVVEVAGPAGSDVVAGAADAGFAVHEVPLVGPLNPVQDARAVLKLARIVRSGGYDVVHAHGFKAGLVGRLGARLGGCKTAVVTAHNHVMYRDDISGFTKWRYRVAERLLIPLTARVITVSDSLRDELVDAYGLPAAKVVTVHNGVDVSAFLLPHDRTVARQTFGLPAAGMVVGTACRFAPQKGLRDLIAALPAVLAGAPGTVLAIGGDGPLEAELRAQADTLGVSDSIVWPGRVTDMPLFLAGLDLYVSSSLSEGLPLTLIEVAAAGVPVVATAAGGTPEVVEDGVGGLLVEPGDYQALAAACVRLLNDPAQASVYAAHARTRAIDEFDPSEMVARTAAVYEGALRETAAAGHAG